MTDLSLDQFDALYSERSFNRPLRVEEISDEFWLLVENLEQFFVQHFSRDEFQIYEGLNCSRFAEVSFTCERYMEPGIVLGVQELIREHPFRWMVCMNEACYLFVTATQILGFDPAGDDADYMKLLEHLRGGSEG
ncbi:hypothetical protein [Verrucomicrobium sp. BvORR106]|uniref:hypothetical protein n=2 Tax=unclassified Verrucomicrobium TaxID=2625155 RepID=UPI00056FA761|nr:hypothetical protein [Verrucomicrobium sp. BvORR106]